MSFPRYPAYKNSGVEWLGEVPEHWEGLRLRFAAMLNPSKQEARLVGEKETVSFLPMEAIGEDGSLILEQEKEIGECQNGYTYFKEGDVCIAKITPCFENGKGAILRDLKGGIGFGTTELIIARPRPEIVKAQFLDYLFRSSTFRSLGGAAMYGAGGQKRVPDSFVRDFPSFLPPIAEQSAISAFLDRETAKIDALIAEQQRLIELLQEKRQAVISHAVTKGLNPDAPMKDSGVAWLGEVPEHWSVTTIKRVVSTPVTDGPHETPEFLDEGIPFVSAEAVSRGTIDFKRIRGFISIDDHNRYSQKYCPRRDDIFMVKSGATTGTSAIVETDIEFNIWSPLAVIRCGPEALPRFVLHFIRSRNFLEAVALGWSFGTQQNIGMGVIENLGIVVPPLEEQRQIISLLECAAGEANLLIVEAERSIVLLQERRSALISAAVTGQIDVRGLAPETSAA